uniref:Phospholipase A1-IIgamma n=1 Tax=Anthurium amnicola TaxID=1678845 RepID=A0A1D1YQ16_9ARAE
MDEYSLSHQSSDSPSLFSSSSSSLPLISPTKTSAIRTSVSNDSSFKPLLKYFGHCLKILVLTFVFDWTQLVRHPVASLATLTMYPTACLVMAVVAVAFYIVERYELRQTNNNLSICNWFYPEMFDKDKKALIDTASSFLEDPISLKCDDILKITTYSDYKDERFSRPSFNIDIAKCLLVLSALMYERKDPKEIDRTDYPIHFTESAPYNEFIKKTAKSWKLKFRTLSELGSDASPFCGAFYQRDKNFIVIAFKGTSPSDFSEWLIDATFMRTDARTHLFGEVHEGFYKALFGDSFKGRSKSIEDYSYRTILANLHEIMKEIRANRTYPNGGTKSASNSVAEEKINVWVAGHSLGSALATLFYSRLMCSPADLPDGCILRDAYVYGTPCIGNSQYAVEFASNCNTPSSRFNTLWRVICDQDMVCRVPIGFDDPDLLRFAGENYLFDYTHVGEAVRFFQDGRKPEAKFDHWLQSNENGRPIESLDEKNKFPDSRWKKIHEMTPACFKDHFPYRYLNAMENASVYFPDAATTKRFYDTIQLAKE